MSVWEGREVEDDENRGFWARFRVVRFGLGGKGTLDKPERPRDVTVVTSLPARQTRETSGCRCGEVTPELEQLRVVALGGHSESIFRSPKRRKDERLISLAVVTSLWIWSDFLSSL
ncbi:hypothetical protein F2Q69_00012235 [Brassica cretica]|uniref:Uncharacterized protein n=1 Tax=Brassica cretica TaxID=69181 RepID=A0A8S9R9Q3_BRACR|nr:hypothetical protein F2Q69_00012235 [Brassica cretica]